MVRPDVAPRGAAEVKRGAGRWNGDGQNVERRTESEQTADGRWSPPTNFGHLVGDLLGMRNFTSARPNLLSIATTWLSPPPSQLCAPSRGCVAATDCARINRRGWLFKMPPVELPDRFRQVRGCWKVDRRR